MVVDRPLSRSPRSVRRFLEGSTRRPQGKIGSLSSGRTLVSAGRSAGGSNCARGVHEREGRSSLARIGLDLSGRHVFRARRSARGEGRLRAVAGGLSPGANGRSRPLRPGPHAGCHRRARQALGLLTELARKGSPEWVDRCWLQIGLIRESAGQLAEAVEAFGTLERVAPASALKPEAQLHRAFALAGLGRAAEATALLRPLAANAAESIGPARCA